MKMKYLIVILAVVLAGTALQSCEKYHGDTYEFSDIQGNYILFSTDDEDLDLTDLQLNSGTDNDGKHVKDTISVDLSTRMNMTSEVNYTYSYEIDGGGSVEVQGVYPAETSSAPIELYTTDAMFPAGTDKITGTIVLTSASNDKGALTIGYPDSTKAKINFTAYKPGS
jgi:hypothetical protein